MFDKKNRFVVVRTFLSKILLSFKKTLSFIKMYPKKDNVSLRKFYDSLIKYKDSLRKHKDSSRTSKDS